jgi:hypothetical protein
MKLLVHHSSVLLQRALLAALPHGGQRASRGNAWAGMSESAARRRAQREADLALLVLDRRLSARAPSALASGH